MNHNKPFGKLSATFLALAAAILLAQLECDASPARRQEQQQSQQSPPLASPTPPSSAKPASEPTPPVGELPVKRRKVWTNDDVVTLRTPADNYEIEKEAEEAADAAAAKKEAAIRETLKSEKQPPLDIKLPATAEETKQTIKNTQSDIHEETVVLQKLHQELLVAPASEQPQKQKDIDGLNALIDKSQRDLKALQDHLQSFPEKPQAENPAAPPQPPSLRNPNAAALHVACSRPAAV
ncbi:MAG: hypothetical protein WA857_17950 [Candidatus Acidiferrum sp.]